MLAMIGCRQVLLLTNNPAKIDGLALTGIEIAGRIPLLTPVHGDNRRYLAAKAMRAGHSLDHLFDALGVKEPSVVPDAAEAS
jgi:GTP cyclohydrolase II